MTLNLTTQVWPGSVVERRLSDGSSVYYVVVSMDSGSMLTIHADSEMGAYALVDAIRAHAVGISN